MATSAPSLELPRAWGRYTLESVLGRGGMGVVYGATLRGRGGFEKPVALKVLEAIDDAEAERALLEEARLGGLLRHPYIVETYDVGVEEGRVYVAMEWVRGPTLTQVLRAGKPLPVAPVVTVVSQLCEALQHAHELSLRGEPLGLVHLDIKPPNVLIDALGLTKLTDFGIARAAGFATVSAQGDQVVGTRGYMAMERLQGQQVDARTDVFAVGTLLAELLLRSRLWPRQGWPAYVSAISDPGSFFAQRHLRRDLDAVLPGVAELILDAVATEPDARVPDVGTLRRRLTALHPMAGDPRALIAMVDGSAAPESTTGVSASVSVAPLTTRRTNLTRVEPAVGREAEREQLAQLLVEGGVVTLMGPGGVGKTTLARAVAYPLVDAFPGGVWFVDLSSSTGVDDVLRHASRVLAVSPDSNDPDALAEQLGHALDARGRCLLVLDNLEQIAEPMGALLASWRAAAPAMTLLLTSQRRIGLRGEQVLSLAGLETDDGVALFTRRAAALGVEVADAEVAQVHALVQVLDGMPLAIELAAARCRMLDPGTMLSAVRAHLHGAGSPGGTLLADRSASRPERHRTLQSAVAWSWSLLSDWQQAALAQLSVFRGAFSVERAREVLDLTAWPDAPWTLFVLEDLLDRSLVAEASGRGRFRLLLPIRAFAWARLSEDPAARQAALRRHGLSFAEYGKTHAIFERHGPRAAEAIADLLVHAADIQWATEQAIAHGETELAFYNVRAWCDVQDAVGTQQAQVEMLERVRVMPRLDGQFRVGLLHQLGAARRHLGHLDAVEAILEEGLQVSRALGDAKWVGIFHAGQAQSLEHTGDYVGVQERYAAAMAAADAGRDRLNRVIYAANNALAIRNEGRIHDALSALREARVLAEERGLAILMAHLDHSIASTLFSLGRFEEARPLCDDALRHCLELHQTSHAVEAHLLRARLAVWAGDRTTAVEHGRAAIELARRRKALRILPDALAVVALRVAAPADPAQTATLAERAQRAYRRVQRSEAWALVALAVARSLAGQPREARALADAAVDDPRPLPALDRAELRAWRAFVADRSGDGDAAAHDRRAVSEIVARTGLPDGSPLAMLLGGRAWP